MRLPDVETVLLAVGLTWFGFRLLRSPRDPALRAVTACLALQLAAMPLGQLAGQAEALGLMIPGLAKVTQNVVLLSSWCGLMLFFLYSTADSRKQARWAPLPLAATTVGITLAMLATPRELRDHMFSQADMTIPGVAAFYLIGGAYFTFIIAQATRWALRYARESSGRLRLGLWIASAGLAINALACAIRAVIVVVRASGGSVSADVLSTTAQLPAVGGIVFVLGVITPPLLLRAEELRTWALHRHRHQQLYPLWTLVHQANPDGAFDRRPRSIWHERLTLRRVHWRYWRRCVEIRDGLVLMSPHLADLGVGPDTPLDQHVDSLTTAAHRLAAGATATSPNAVLVAAPAADAGANEQLIRISRTLRQH